MKKYLAPFALLLCSLLFPSGCTSTGAIIISGLRIELTGLERTGDGAVTVSWRILNPNVAPYLLSQVSNKIYLNGTLVGTTLDVEPIAVPAQNRGDRTAKLKVAGPAADRLIADAASQSPVSYRVDSKLVIQLYGDAVEKGDLTGSGSVKVTGK